MQLLRQLVEDAPDVLFRLALPLGTFDYVNPAAQRILGQGAEAFYEEPRLLHDCVPPEWQAFFEQQWQLLLGGNPPPSLEYPVVVRGTDQRRWLHQRNTLLTDEQGRPVAVQGIISDITERKHMEERLCASDAQYQPLFGLSTIGVGLADCTTGRLLRANQKYSEILGYPPEELIGQEFQDLTHPDDLRANRELQQKLLRGELADYALEKRYIRKDGEVIWVRITAVLLRDGQHRPLHLLGIIQEIGEHKWAESALRESEARWRALVETTHDLIWEVDEQGRYSYVSPQVRQILGYEPDEMLGRRPIEFVFPEEVEGVLPQFLAVSEQCEPFGGLENINLHKDGSRVVLETNGAPYFDQDGGFRGFRGIDRDITGRKVAEQALADSESRYRALMEQASDAILVADANGRFTDANQRALEMFGYTKEELLTMGPSDLYHPEEVTRVRQAFGELNDRGTSLYKYQARTKEGQLILVEVAGTRIVFDDSYLYLGSFRDISERERQAMALRRTSEELEAMFANIHVHISVMDPEFNFLRVNAAYAAGTGHTPDYFVGKNHFALYPHAENEKIFRQVVVSGEPYSVMAKAFEYPSEPERETTYWDWTLAPMKDDAGRVNGIVLSLIDVTESERRRRESHEVLERRVAERTEELELMNKELEAFTYSVSHDLRAPLRGIGGFSQMLLRNKNNQFDATGQDHLARILRATGRMNALIDDLLRLSRLMRVEPRRRDVELGELAREVIEQMIQAEPDRLLQIHIAAGLVVRADAGLMRVVLENLLGNAWKFTANRSPAVIEFGSSARNSETVYYVRDNGAGFDMRCAEKLFAPFQRLHSEQEFPGSGVGLATVDRIIRRHGGRVWAEGVIESGAIFYFTLGCVAEK